MILDARPLVEKRVIELKNRVDKLKSNPYIAIIKIGKEEDKERYIKNKKAMGERCGVKSKIFEFDNTVKQSVIEKLICRLNNDESITSILLQLPIPKHLDSNYLISLINPDKDVDGFTEANIGRLVLNRKGNVACTPKGIISLLKFYNIELEGKDVLIINRSDIVGKPLAHLLLRENATVTIAHSKSKSLYNKINKSDIIITAVGKKDFLDCSMFDKGQVVIDVSINYEKGKLYGDVKKDDYKLMSQIGIHFSPVPFGVGQTTVLSLIEQTIEIAESKEK